MYSLGASCSLLIYILLFTDQKKKKKNFIFLVPYKNKTRSADNQEFASCIDGGLSYVLFK